MRLHLPPPPEAIVKQWAGHAHPDVSRIAASLPTDVEGTPEVARGNPLAVHMPAGEAALLEPLLRAFEPRLRAHVAALVQARPENTPLPRAAQVMAAIARVPGVGRQLQVDTLTLYASRGGGMKVYKSHVFVGRFEWGTPRTVLHIYIACDSAEPNARVVVRVGCAPVCVYASSCQCASPNQAH